MNARAVLGGVEPELLWFDRQGRVWAPSTPVPSIGTPAVDAGSLSPLPSSEPAAPMEEAVTLQVSTIGDVAPREDEEDEEDAERSWRR